MNRLAQIPPRLVGEANALEIFLTAKRLDAKEALRIRLIDKVSDVPLEEALKQFDDELSKRS